MPTGFTYPTYDEWRGKFPSAFSNFLDKRGVDWLQNYYSNRNRSQLEYQANQPAGGNPSINLPDPNQYFNPQLIQNLYNTAGMNLGRQQGSSVASAQRTAAALAGSGGALNPQAFVTGAGSQARQPFAQAFGRLEEGRAGALNAQQQALLQALTTKGQLEEQSRQFNVNDERSRQQLAQQWELALKQLKLQSDAQSAGGLDWISALLPLLTAPVTGGTSLLGYLLPKGSKPAPATGGGYPFGGGHPF